MCHGYKKLTSFPTLIHSGHNAFLCFIGLNQELKNENPPKLSTSTLLNVISKKRKRKYKSFKCYGEMNYLLIVPFKRYTNLSHTMTQLIILKNYRFSVYSFNKEKEKKRTNYDLIVTVLIQ